MTDTYRVGTRSADTAAPTAFTPDPFKRAKAPDPLQFEVNLVAEAGTKQHKTGTVSVNIPGFSPLTLYCDEQPPVGEDQAPPPLAYFCAGIGFCLMTHLTDIYTARRIEITSLRLEQRVRFATNLGHMRDLGHTTTGQTELVETHVLIDSPEPPARIKDLLAEAEGACMAHFALRNPIPWTTRLVHNGETVVDHAGNGA